MQDPSQNMLYFGAGMPPMHPVHTALLQAHMHMPALPMRRTRSRTSSTDNGLAIPPALPMQESLSEAALSIGLEMEEATRQLMQDGGLPIRRSRSRGPSQLSTSFSSAPQAAGRGTMGQHLYRSGFAQSEGMPPPAMPPALPSAPPPAPALPPAPPLQTSLSKVLEGLDGPGSPLLGSPMRRTRSRGLGPLPMIHSISELVSSFISDGPGLAEERGGDEDDILAGW